MRIPELTIAVAAIALASQAALAQMGGEAAIQAKQSEKYGQYVADGDGRALYMFTADTRGKGADKAVSNCYDKCAEAWPPMIVTDEPRVREELDEALLGTIERKNGEMQVTYGGWPLYYYAEDQSPGSVKGQDVHGSGGEWYLVGPDGSKVEGEG